MVEDQQAEGEDAQPVEVGAAFDRGDRRHDRAPGDGHRLPLTRKLLIYRRFVTTGAEDGTTGGRRGTSGQVLTGASASNRWR